MALIRSVASAESRADSFANSGESRPTSRVAHSFGSGKLYICLSNKCFKVNLKTGITGKV